MQPCEIMADNHRCCGCSTPAAVTEAVDRMAEVAPQVQDDFDLQEGVLAELELQDRPENQVRSVKDLKCFFLQSLLHV